MGRRLKLTHHRHTGRLLHNQHTSWAGLAFLSLCLGVAMTILTAAVLAAETKSVKVSAIVPAPAPKTAPTITKPVNGQVFSKIPISVEGTCLSGYRVEVYRNNSLAGATICSGSGEFVLSIDLFEGKNLLSAAQFNSYDVASPRSNIVEVTYKRPVGGGVSFPQFLILTDKAYQGLLAGETAEYIIEVVGGNKPYAFSVNWGDGTVDLISVATAGRHYLKHQYQGAGTFQISISGSDNRDQKASLQLLAIVRGPVAAASISDRGILLIVWPIYVALLLMLASFWLGERHEDHIWVESGFRRLKPVKR